MPTVAHDLFALVMKDLDDENAVRTTTPALFLRHATRAQQWVALRYQLLRETFLFSLYLNTPVYALAATGWIGGFLRRGRTIVASSLLSME